MYNPSGNVASSGDLVLAGRPRPQRVEVDALRGISPDAILAGGFRARQKAPAMVRFVPLSSPLAVHHRTYAHRGEEWRYLDDLTVLCEGCHTCHHKERK